MNNPHHPLNAGFPAGFPTFSGSPSENFRLWKVQATEGLKFVHQATWDDAVLGVLRGAALRTAVAYLKTNPASRNTMSLLDFLSSRFGTATSPFIARCRLRALIQTGSVEEYTCAFNEIAAGIFPCVEIELLGYYLTGLRPTTGRLVLARGPSTLAEAIICATELDISNAIFASRPAPFNNHMDRVEQETTDIEDASLSAARFAGRQQRRCGRRSPPGPCRFCKGNHWNNECPRRTQSRPNKYGDSLYSLGQATLGAIAASASEIPGR